MEQVETAKIKESLINFPELVKKIEGYFTKETPAATEEVKVEEVKVEEAEPVVQDFSVIIAEFEKTFVKTSDFTAQSEAFTKSAEVIATLTKSNEELTAKFAKQEEAIKEIFELVKKIGATPSEESKFKKKDGVVTPVLSKIDQLMADAKVLSAKTFK